MSYTLTRLSDSGSPALMTLSDAKVHLRVDHDEEDALISSLIDVAKDTIEQRIWRSLTTSTWRYMTADYQCGIPLPRPPVISIETVSYRDAKGVLTPTLMSDYWFVPEEARLHWHPTITFPKDTQAVVIDYTAGFTIIPPALIQAARLMIGNWFNQREMVIFDRAEIFETIPTAATNLMELWSARSYVSNG